jgi:hypothetical protein
VSMKTSYLWSVLVAAVVQHCIAVGVYKVTSFDQVTEMVTPIQIRTVFKK